MHLCCLLLTHMPGACRIRSLQELCLPVQLQGLGMRLRTFSLRMQGVLPKHLWLTAIMRWVFKSGWQCFTAFVC